MRLDQRLRMGKEECLEKACEKDKAESEKAMCIHATRRRRGRWARRMQVGAPASGTPVAVPSSRFPGGGGDGPMS